VTHRSLTVPAGSSIASSVFASSTGFPPPPPNSDTTIPSSSCLRSLGLSSYTPTPASASGSSSSSLGFASDCARCLRPLPTLHNPEVQRKPDRRKNANHHTSRNPALRSSAQRTWLRPSGPSSKRRGDTAAFREITRADAFEHAVRRVTAARSLRVRDGHVDCEDGRDGIRDIVVPGVTTGGPFGGGDWVAEACLVESLVAG
jgi:hypothetical protein